MEKKFFALFYSWHYADEQKHPHFLFEEWNGLRLFVNHVWCKCLLTEMSEMCWYGRHTWMGDKIVDLRDDFGICRRIEGFFSLEDLVLITWQILITWILPQEILKLEANFEFFYEL